MNRPLVCMTLTGTTLEEDARLVKKYEKYVDLVELRVDYLTEDEQLLVRRFPSMIYKPCILTIRRDIDGGLFTGGDFSRTTLFGRALSFANTDKTKNFAYVDFEEDFDIPSIQDAAQAFGVRIIRSCHNMKGPVYNLKEHCNKMRKTGFEIPKIAFKPESLSDVENLFREGAQMKDIDHIFCAMGVEGFPSRLLSAFSNSYLTFVSPKEVIEHTRAIGHIDPVELEELYNFRSITTETQLYGIAGWPIVNSSGPSIINPQFKKHDLNSVIFPLCSENVSDALSFADFSGMRGLSVSVPYKESVMYYLQEQAPEVIEIGACNTIVKKNNRWQGYNTDAYGFRRAMEEFLDGDKIKRKKVAVIGAGGAAKAIVYALKQMGAHVCVFNRTVEHAKLIAEKHGFKYCQLDASCIRTLEDYSDIIVQTTSIGMNSDGSISQKNDPIYFYDFKGTEKVFDVIYTPDITPVMKRAALAGCKVSNGYKMFRYQSEMQFKLFTGKEFIE